MGDQRATVPPEIRSAPLRSFEMRSTLQDELLREVADGAGEAECAIGRGVEDGEPSATRPEPLTDAGEGETEERGHDLEVLVVAHEVRARQTGGEQVQHKVRRGPGEDERRLGPGRRGERRLSKGSAAARARTTAVGGQAACPRHTSKRPASTASAKPP